VGFAVFSVGSALGAEREGELAREVGPSVAVLRQS